MLMSHERKGCVSLFLYVWCIKALSGWSLDCASFLESWGSISRRCQACCHFTEAREARRTGFSGMTGLTRYTLWTSFSRLAIPCNSIQTRRTWGKVGYSLILYSTYKQVPFNCLVLKKKNNIDIHIALWKFSRSNIKHVFWLVQNIWLSHLVPNIHICM